MCFLNTLLRKQVSIFTLPTIIYYELVFGIRPLDIHPVIWMCFRLVNERSPLIRSLFLFFNCPLVTSDYARACSRTDWRAPVDAITFLLLFILKVSLVNLGGFWSGREECYLWEFVFKIERWGWDRRLFFCLMTGYLQKQLLLHTNHKVPSKKGAETKTRYLHF